MRHRGTVTLLWVATAAFVAYFVGQALAPGAVPYRSAAAIHWLGALPKMVFPGLATWWAWRVARHFEAGNPSRFAWQLLALGMGGLFLGQVILFGYHLLDVQDAFPSWGDPFFVGGCVALVVALWAFVRLYLVSGLAADGGGRLALLGVGAAAVTAAGIVPLLLPIARAAAPPLEKALNLAYPSFDLLMLIPALLMLRIAFRFRGGTVARAWLALVAGILFTALADILWGYFSNLQQEHLGPAIDALYILAYGCLAAGVLYQRVVVED